MTDAMERTAPSPTNEELFARYIDEYHKRDLSNTENFDKAILTLSSAALALSITFLGAIIDAGVVSRSTMAISWACFVIAILSTLFSFLVSQKSLRRSCDQAQRYYLECDAGALLEPNHWANANTRLSYVSGAAFVLGIIFLLVFVSSNLGDAMKEGQISKKHGPTTTVPTIQAAPFIGDRINAGANPPTVRKIVIPPRPVTPPPVQKPSE